MLTAAIWGFAFVAQRKGLESLDPFSFNALRFSLGAASVAIVGRVFKSHPPIRVSNPAEGIAEVSPPLIGKWQPMLLGVLLFIAASLQQTGMIWTGAGSAGFITGLYVVFVPLIGLLRGQALRPYIGLAVALSVGGLWLMNGNAELAATMGNLCVLGGAVFWAFHVQMVDKLSKLQGAFKLAEVQFAVCAALSLLASLGLELVWPRHSSVGPGFWGSAGSALLPITYAGILSVGVAFTLQIHAQKKVKPHTASVVLCLEGVFALFGGWLLLGEEVGLTSLAGGALLFAAMLVSIMGERGKFFLIDKKRPRKR